MYPRAGLPGPEVGLKYRRVTGEMTICRVHPMTWDRVVQRTMPAPSRGGQTDVLAICHESFIEMNLNEFYCQFSEKDNDPHSRRALDIASFPCKSTLWGLPQSKKLFETRIMVRPLSSNLRLWDQFPGVTNGIARAAALPGRAWPDVLFVPAVIWWTAASGNPRKRTQDVMALTGSEFGLRGSLDR